MAGHTENDAAMEAFSKVKQFTEKMSDQLSHEDYIRFSHMSLGLFTNFEKNIVRELELASRYCGIAEFDDLRGNIINRLFKRGQQLMKQEHTRKRKFEDNNDTNSHSDGEEVSLPELLNASSYSEAPEI